MLKIAKYENVKVWTVMQQVKKICEEFGELIEAIFTGKKQNVLSEGFDLIQSVFTLFFILGYTKDDIQTHLKLHYQKLEIRDHEGELKIEDWIEV